MGHRTMKRVPLDFDWPLDKTWGGYLNEHYRKCPECEGGRTSAREYLEALVRLILLVGADAHRGEQHPYFLNFPVEVPYGVASPDMVELTTGLAGRAPQDGPFGGHDACDLWAATRAIVGAAGLDPKTWGICAHCEGQAIDPEAAEACEDWEPTEPPEGEGWQLWETVSEGSPISPVFATADELADWCVATDGALGPGGAALPKQRWLAMFAGEEDLEAGSLMVLAGGQFGTVAEVLGPSGDE